MRLRTKAKLVHVAPRTRRALPTRGLSSGTSFPSAPHCSRAAFCSFTVTASHFLRDAQISARQLLARPSSFCLSLFSQTTPQLLSSQHSSLNLWFAHWLQGSGDSTSRPRATAAGPGCASRLFSRTFWRCQKPFPAKDRPPYLFQSFYLL